MHKPLPEKISERRSFRASQIIGLLLIVTGAAVLFGRVVQPESVRRLYPELVAVNPLTVFCLTLLGFSSLLLGRAGSGGAVILTARIIASIVIGTSLVCLAAYIFGYELAPDSWISRQRFFSESLSLPTGLPPNTAFNLLLTGLVLVALDWQWRSYVRPGEAERYRAEMETMAAIRTEQLEKANLRLEEEVEERRRGEERTQQQVQRILALHTIDQAITSSLDLKTTLQVFLDQVTTQLGVDAAATLLVNEATNTLDFAAHRGFKTDALRYTRLPIGQGYAGHCAMTRKLIHVSNLLQSSGQFVRSHRLGEEGFVTYFAVPLVAKGKIAGVLEIFHRKVLHPDKNWLDFLDTLAGQAAIAIDNAELYTNLQKSNSDLEAAYERTLEGWVKALDIRDEETEGHTQRVTEMTLRLAQAMDLTEESLVNIRRGALLHDIGKLGIPDSILLKPGELTEEEWVIMRKHPVYAYEWLSPIPYLRDAIDIPYYHHEKWDGTGYPNGLKGENIPLAARIFAVVDIWDALRSDRPYRKRWTDEAIRDYLLANSGSHFDPLIVPIFIELELENAKSSGEALHALVMESVPA